MPVSNYTEEDAVSWWMITIAVFVPAAILAVIAAAVAIRYKRRLALTLLVIVSVFLSAS